MIWRAIQKQQDGMAAIFTDASFPSIAPAGAIAIPVPTIAGRGAGPYPGARNDPVILTLSDTTRVTVFDKLLNGMRPMEQMRQRDQWLLQASDDVFIASCGAKLLICEATLVNQKLFASFMPTYVGGQTRFANRSMSSLMTLADALQSVGFCLQGQTIQNNADLTNMQGPPHILIVDWNVLAVPGPSAPATAGFILDDGANQLVYTWQT